MSVKDLYVIAMMLAIIRMMGTLIMITTDLYVKLVSLENIIRLPTPPVHHCPGGEFQLLEYQMGCIWSITKKRNQLGSPWSLWSSSNCWCRILIMMKIIIIIIVWSSSTMGQILPSDEFMMIFFMMIVFMMMAVMLMFIMMMMMMWRASLQHWGRELRGKLKTALEAALQAQGLALMTMVMMAMMMIITIIPRRWWWRWWTQFCLWTNSL